jgi:hypothetical protein
VYSRRHVEQVRALRRGRAAKSRHEAGFVVVACALGSGTSPADREEHDRGDAGECQRLTVVEAATRVCRVSRLRTDDAGQTSERESDEEALHDEQLSKGREVRSREEHGS